MLSLLNNDSLPARIGVFFVVFSLGVTVAYLTTGHVFAFSSIDDTCSSADDSSREALRNSLWYDEHSFCFGNPGRPYLGWTPRGKIWMAKHVPQSGVCISGERGDHGPHIEKMDAEPKYIERLRPKPVRSPTPLPGPRSRSQRLARGKRTLGCGELFRV